MNYFFLNSTLLAVFSLLLLSLYVANFIQERISRIFFPLTNFIAQFWIDY